MKHLLIVLIVGCLSGGALGAPGAEAPALQRLSGDPTPLIAGERLIFLGDSITDAGDHPGGYVDRIRQSIGQRAEVIGAGIGGNKVPDLQGRLGRDVLERQPTLVFVYIGINDVWHDPGGTPIEKYEAGLHDILQRLEDAGIITILATPTVIGERFDGTNPHDKQLDAYAAVSRKVAKQFGVELCDLRAVFLEYLKEHNPDNAPQGILTSDTVHLTELGNQVVAEAAAGSILRALEARSGRITIPVHAFVNEAQVRILIRDPEHTKVYYTTDGSEPDENATAYTGPFSVDRTTRVRAVGIGRDGSKHSADATFEQVKPLAPDQGVSAWVPGLRYIAARGGFQKLPRFEEVEIEASGVTPGLALPEGLGEQFAVRYDGYLDVPEAGVYEFILTSDDGSALWIGPERVVDHDGLHGADAKTGQIALGKGYYPIRVAYFNAGGGSALRLSWSRQGEAPRPVPDEAFLHVKGAGEE